MPVKVAPPVAVAVQLPDGNPVNATVPVASVQVGWILTLAEGTAGVTGCAFTITLDEAGDVQAPIDTVKV